jgi:hypothetical protein
MQGNEILAPTMANMRLQNPANNVNPVGGFGGVPGPKPFNASAAVPYNLEVRINYPVYPASGAYSLAHGDREYPIISFFLCGYDHSGFFCLYHAYDAELSTSSTCFSITECFFSIASTDCYDSAWAYCSLCASFYSTT